MKGALKVWIFRAAAILFGILLLVLLEGGLRLFWDPPSSFEEQIAAVVIDPFEIEQGMARTKSTYRGALRFSQFEVPKPAGMLRVFCLGGSTTFGYPYTSDMAWPSVLERTLRGMFPGRSVEIINLGGTAYGSARTLAVLRGITAYQPDAVIVATGDAEFVEDSFRASVDAPRSRYEWLHGLYLSRAIKNLLPEKQERRVTVNAEDRSAAGFLFAPIVEGTVYHVDAARRAEVMTTYGENLVEMIRVANEAGIPLVLATLPANVASWPPDPDSKLPPHPEVRVLWQSHIDAARRESQLGNRDAALRYYEAAAKLWVGNASVCFEYGQELFLAGRYEVAKGMLQNALDLDPAPVRATSRVNATIRDVASANGVPVVDAAQAFVDLSPYGLIGEDLILDYAHPTPRGQVEIARVVYRELVNVFPALSVDIPLQESVFRHEMELSLGRSFEGDAQCSFALAQVLERKGLLDRASMLYRQAIASGYEGPYPALNLARILAIRGDYQEALDLVVPWIEVSPNWSEPYGLLGYLYENLKNRHAAINWYRKAIASGDKDPRLYISLSRLYVATGQIDQAIELLEAGWRASSSRCEMSGELGRILEEHRLADAEEYYRGRLQEDPDCALLWEGLGLFLMGEERWEEAEVVFLSALEQPGAPPQHHLNLGYVYWRGMQDDVAASEQFQKFLGLEPGAIGLVPAHFRALLQKEKQHGP